jgi:hypothetical protein
MSKKSKKDDREKRFSWLSKVYWQNAMTCDDNVKDYMKNLKVKKIKKND